MVVMIILRIVVSDEDYDNYNRKAANHYNEDCHNK